MGKFQDAILARRQANRLGPPSAPASKDVESGVLVGTTGLVAGADHCIAVSETDVAEIEQAEIPLWGIRFTALTSNRLEMAKARGASYVSCTLDDIQAAVALDEDLDIAVRLLDTDMDEATLKALARLRPAVIARATAQFPLSLRDAVSLHRLGMLTGVPLAIPCPIDVSSGDLKVLRDAEVGSIMLPRGATADDVAAIKRRIANLPESGSILPP